MAFPKAKHSHQDLLDAQAHIWNHIFNFINSMSLKCTIELGIPDIIHKHGQPIMLSELIEALSINKEKSIHIERLMRVMVHSNFFIMVKIVDDDDKEGYWLTPSSFLLLRDETFSVASFALFMLNPISMAPWHKMSEWFKSVDHADPFVATHGMTFWEFIMQDGSMNMLFNECMAKDTRFMSDLIVKDCRPIFYGLKSIVDVGGGTGTMAKALTDAFLGLACTVLDLPHVVRDLEGSKNLTYVEGDMFEFIPPADATLLKWILHDWPDKDCVKILKKCKEAIVGKKEVGKVIIIEMVIDDDNKKHEEKETQLFFDMLMLMVTNGKERTEEEWARLFAAAGFTGYKITNIFGLRSIIELFP